MHTRSAVSRGIVIYAGLLVAGARCLHLQAAHPQDTPAARPSESAPVSPTPPSVAPPASPAVVLNRYCVTCHNSKLKTAGLMLDTLDVEHVGTHAEIWEKVTTKLRTREMPPPG